MQRVGRIQELFDLSPYKSLGEIPELKEPGEIDRYARFFSRIHFSRLEDPERFYTSLPTVEIALYRPEEQLFLGIVKPMETVPNITLESSSCIIYTDEQNRLKGFNHNFYLFFKNRYPDPHKMLNQALEDFLSPTPEMLFHEEISKSPIPPLSSFKIHYETDFGMVRDRGGLILSDERPVSFTEEGMVCKNTTGDVIFFTLPVTVDSKDDILLSVEAEVIRGAPPLFFYDRKPGPGNYKEAYPDTDGYLLGMDRDAERYLLKRWGTIQRIGKTASADRKGVYAMAKIGSVFRYLENREERLAYCDFNFLHDRKINLTVGVRIGSEVMIRSVKLWVQKNPSTGREASFPMVRLKNPAETFAHLSRVSNVALSMRFPETSIYLLENITEIKRQVNLLKRENRKLLLEMGRTEDGFIGGSPAIQAIKRNASIVAASTATILIQGETGTGKEQLARFICMQSPRKDGPFIKVDCSTLSKTLLESELFGHEKGAFTGAIERKIGSFERANRGTLFLDEVGNLPAETQAKLLHFLQDHTITRVGGGVTIPLDIRVIVASNVSLPELVKKGLFRADLFYRMDVVTITLPPLRERKDDLPDFCRAFLQASNIVNHKNISDFSPGAYQKIYSHGWPGNVRELKNTVERAVIFCEGDIIDDTLITFSTDTGAPPVRKRNAYQFKGIELPAVKALLQKHHGNASLVIKELGIPSRTFYAKLRRLGVSIRKLREEGL